VVEQEVETLKDAEEIGVGIRVVSAGRVGFSYTTDLDELSLDAALQRAMGGAAHAAADEYNGLPPAPSGYPLVDTYDPAIRHTELEQKVEMAQAVERAARAFDRRVRLVERAGYEESVYVAAVVSTEGVRAAHQAARCGLFAYVVAEEAGDAQTGFSVMARLRIGELDARQVGEEAARNAVRMLGARPLASQKLPCVLDPYVATRFLAVTSAALSAEAVQKGRSWLGGLVGQAVGSPVVTIIDDGLLAGGLASFPFDGEGTPAQRKVLVEAGVLRGYLHDAYTARKGGTVSTGNGVRASFRALPAVGPTNLFLQPGEVPARELAGTVTRGLYVSEVMGMHTANPISGDFSVGAAGLLIENGRLASPVRGVTIAGNLRQLLQEVEAVGDDLRFYGRMGAPSLRVRGLSVAGE
ncbi:MAG: TldD/PmbA family protein, partial [Syntrophomonadaceae bacterium]|jgi:PmbA protein|nr:TldD/PmbA family protein [Syntrophomonadaceae bacterium]